MPAAIGVWPLHLTVFLLPLSWQRGEMFIDAMYVMRFCIVDFYLARQLLTGIAVALLALLAIDGVIDFLDEIDKVDADYPIGTMLFYSVLEIAVSAYELLPIAVLLGCMVGLGSMAVNFEFLALRACGYTRMRIAYSYFSGRYFADDRHFYLRRVCRAQGTISAI